jgi:hypothetical protein
MDYKFAGDFNKAPLGPFVEANKKLVWPDLSYDADKTAKYFELVADDRFPGGRACRCKYPKGSLGMNDQFYQVRLKSPQQAINLEMLWLFEPNFSFMTPNNNKTCGGKIGPCINWSEVGGETAKRGTRAMMWWNGSGSNYPPAGGTPVFSPSCQDQRSGNQLIQPAKYSRRIELDKIYKFRFQCMGGDNGWAKYWITYPGDTEETLFADTGKRFLQVTPEDDVLIDFAFFSGGATHPDNETEWDSFARHGGVRYWSGEAYWEDTGNGGDTGTGGGGGTTPTPPAGGHIVDAVVIIDGDAYEGRLTKA